MFSHVFKALGKSLLIVTGVGYGVAKALEGVSVETRLDSFEQRLSRLEATLANTHAKLDRQLEERFNAQDQAVQSLRAMVSRTDELLEQIIENIESMSVNA